MSACIPCFSRGIFRSRGGLLVLARKLGFKVAAQIHGSSFKDFSTKHPRLVRSVLSRANLVMSLTNETTAAVEDAISSTPTVGKTENETSIIQINNAVSVGEFRETNEKENIILLAGEIGERKGVDILVAAWTIIQADLPGWRLQIVGPKADPPLTIPNSPVWKYLGQSHIPRFLRD